MKLLIKLLVTLTLLVAVFVPIQAQRTDIGFILGGSFFLGDLGGSRGVGKGFISDVDYQAIRPAGGIYIRRNFSKRWSFRLAGMAVMLSADDNNITDQVQPGDDAWFRRTRNLHFRTMVYEGTGMIEFNLLKFRAGSRRYKFTPFIGAGVGLFYFNPRAKYNDEWVSLQPIGTEGQGLPEFPNRQPYDRLQVSLVGSLGFKYVINRRWSLSGEVMYRQTFTDYLDDVSTTYVAQEVFEEFYSPEDALRAYTLSNPSIINDPEREFDFVTAPGNQRGDPSDDDQFFTVQVSLYYYLKAKRYKCKTNFFRG